MRLFIVLLALLVLVPVTTARNYTIREITQLLSTAGLDIDTLETDTASEALEVDTLQAQVGAWYLVAFGSAAMTNDTVKVVVAAADSADMVLATYSTAGGTLLIGASVLADDTLTLYGDSASVIHYGIFR